MTNWHEYRKCPIDQAPTGRPCLARSGRIVGGHPDGVAVELEQPHVMRRKLKRYGLNPTGGSSRKAGAPLTPGGG